MVDMTVEPADYLKDVGGHAERTVAMMKRLVFEVLVSRTGIATAR